MTPKTTSSVPKPTSSGSRRPQPAQLERDIQHAIRLELGKHTDLVLFRNSAGVATMTDEQGRDRTQRFGLAVGMPDLVGVLGPGGRWVGLEVKRPGQKPRREQLACHELRALGYRVIDAASGAQALPLLDAEEPIDLLFTDVVMPGGMSGRQLADEARRRRPGLRVLYTSGYSENAIVHHGRLDTGVQLLPKPYRRADLARAIRQALGSPAA